MSFELKRTRFSKEGIFGELLRNGIHVAFTLEHSYNLVPKLAPGTYTCIRGMHTLHSTPTPFEAFMVQDVPDFDGHPVINILIHFGNYNQDSDGCILIGKTTSPDMIGHSREAFKDFMNSLSGINQIQLIVK